MMIKAILIDDERPALRELEFLLKRYPEISIEGLYTNPLEALDAIAEIKPEVVFLDINMPQLNGTDAASKITDVDPGVDIVFITAFDQYAVEAFELHALDYLLKPVNPERLSKTVERLLKTKPVTAGAHERKLKIKCLGGLGISWEKAEPIKWRTEKTKEVFAYLLHNRGRDLSKDEIIDELWPDDDPEKAVRQLYNGIYYIRKALEGYGVDRSLVCISPNYHLKLGDVDFDVERFTVGDHTSTVEELERMESLYKGDYLDGEYYSWADIERERLSKLYIRLVTKLAKKLIEEKEWGKAENYLKKAYNKDSYEEETTSLLVALYIETGNISQAILHFNTYSELIARDLGIKPQRELAIMVNGVKMSQVNDALSN